MVKIRSVRTISRKGFNREQIRYFLTGFVEGEGSFNVSLRKKSDYKVKWQVVLSFNVSQKDPEVLYLLKKELGCGIIKVRKKDKLHSFDVTNSQDIVQKVIPYFRKYHLVSKQKQENFKTFSQIAILVAKGKHRKINGLKKIMSLRERLNIGKGRKRKYGYSDIFPVKKSSETIRQTPI